MVRFVVALQSRVQLFSQIRRAKDQHARKVAQYRTFAEVFERTGGDRAQVEAFLDAAVKQQRAEGDFDWEAEVRAELGLKNNSDPLNIVNHPFLSDSKDTDVTVASVRAAFLARVLGSPAGPAPVFAHPGQRALAIISARSDLSVLWELQAEYGGTLPPSPPPLPAEVQEQEARLSAPMTEPLAGGPPAHPPGLLESQVCEDCGAPYCRPSPMVGDPALCDAADGSVRALCNADVLRETLDLDLEAALEALEALGVAGEGPAAGEAKGPAQLAAEAYMAAAGAEEWAAEDRKALRTAWAKAQTLAAMGIGEDALAEVLRTRPSDAVGEASPLPLFKQTGMRPLSLTPSKAASNGAGSRGTGCLGGFAPVVTLAYDERMLLHEEAVRPSQRVRLTLLGCDDASTLVLPPALHPERPDRLRAVAQHLAATGLFQRCRRSEVRECDDSDVRTVHGADYTALMAGLNELVAESADSTHNFGSDTYCNQFTLRAARLACGATLAVTEDVARGRADRGFALVRPPGHHAEPDAAMGFCFYNNVGVAARMAREQWGVRRVLIVDWDVHHGNGTERMFLDDPSVLFVSLHRYERGAFYPGTGHPETVGEGAGRGYNMNIGWSHTGMGDAEYLAAFDELIMPVAQSFAPDLVLISAGFDAARGDPLGGFDITPAGYAHMTHRLLGLASGRVVAVLEGGYNLRSIARSVEAVVRVMLGQAPPPLLPVPAQAHSRVQTGAPADKSGSAGNGAGEDNADDKARGEKVVDRDALLAKRILEAHTSLDAALSQRAGCEEPRGRLPLRLGDTFLESPRRLLAATEPLRDLDRDAALGKLVPHQSALDAIDRTMNCLAPFWPVLAAHLGMTDEQQKSTADEEANIDSDSQVEDSDCDGRCLRRINGECSDGTQESDVPDDDEGFGALFAIANGVEPQDESDDVESDSSSDSDGCQMPHVLRPILKKPRLE
jgi:histone deacetylase 6